MSETKPTRLTNLDCIVKAEECRRMARLAFSNQHRSALNQMAETWERIGTDIETRGRKAVPRIVQ